MKREEAIKELRSFIGQLTEGCREAIKVLIPELKESEDERIRDGLIQHLKELRDWKVDTMCPIKVSSHYDAWIAWLEKQKVITEGDFGRGYDCGYQAGYAVAMNEMEPKVAMATLDSEKQKEQKPAEWNENDENKLNHILEIVHIASGSEVSIDEKEELESFLKSLQPQPKQEWSEEDKFKLEDAITGIDVGIGFYETEGKHPNLLKAIIEAKEWLKSLRPSWKPSEEQILALRTAVIDCPDDKELLSLYEDLKKL